MILPDLAQWTHLAAYFLAELADGRLILRLARLDPPADEAPSPTGEDVLGCVSLKRSTLLNYKILRGPRKTDLPLFILSLDSWTRLILPIEAYC